MKPRPFPILFGVDTGYVPHLATAIYSLLSNNKNLDLRIVVLTAGIPKKDVDRLRHITAEFGVPFELKLLDDSHLNGLSLTNHYTKAIYLRLFAADVLEDDRCLYLDSDLIVDGSIQGLLECDLQDQHVAAVLDNGFLEHKKLGMSSLRYFNSGVMLINLDQWRKSGFKDTVFSFLRNYPERISLPDQCAMNAVLDGNWIELGIKYNLLTYMLTNSSKTLPITENHPVIIHFGGGVKPWHLASKDPYKKQYWSYRNKTPYVSSFYDDISLKTILSYLLPSWMKSSLKSLIRPFRKSNGL